MSGWTAFGLSDTGRVRARNEDAFAVDAEHGWYLVADGLGGHPGGDVASRMARDAVLATLGDEPDALAAGDTGEALRRAMDAANRAIVRAADADPSLAGMGTTLSVLWLPTAGDGARDSAAQGRAAHAGDSRIYRLGSDGFVQLTEDHTVGMELVRARVLTRAEAEGSIMWHRLTRAAGIDETLEADVFAVDTTGAEAFLLCSDGLTGMVDDGAIERLLRGRAGEPRAACEALVGAALENGGRDNVTVVVVCQPRG